MTAQQQFQKSLSKYDPAIAVEAKKIALEAAQAGTERN